jgi:AcrR family transcriptional regulator
MTEETPARRPRADAQRNQERLLQAARAAFAAARETGAPVALEQVARQAGVGIGTLYRHFPSREALVEALYREEVELLCARVDTLLTVERLRPDLALRRWMDYFADYAEAKQEMGDALRALIDAGVVTAAKSRKRLAGALRQLLEAGAADGTLRADLRAEDMVTVIVGVVSATAISGGREQLGRLFDLLVDGARGPGSSEPIRSNHLLSNLFEHMIYLHQVVRIFVSQEWRQVGVGSSYRPGSGSPGCRSAPLPRSSPAGRPGVIADSADGRTAGPRYGPVVNAVHGVPITAGPVGGVTATRAPTSPTFPLFAQVRGVGQCPAGYFAANG